MPKLGGIEFDTHTNDLNDEGETEFEVIDAKATAGLGADHNLLRQRFEDEFKASLQSKKSAFIFGSVSQSPFYKACEQQEGTEIISKFHQSGVLGFLPISDPGVCSFMSDDFALSVTEGRYKTWKDKITHTDKAFIERLRAGQYGGDLDSNANMQSNLGTKSPFAPSLEAISRSTDSPKMDNFQLRSLAESIASKMNVSDTATSCLEAPCVKLNVFLERPVRWKKNPRFGHSMMFTMAVDEKGRLDKDYLLFMDANSGVIKIRNNKESIGTFLESIDTKLFSQMRVVSADINVVTNSNLPPKDSSAWRDLDQKIQNGNAPDKESNYAQCKLGQLDTYLQLQIARLECKGIWERITGKVDEARETKLTFFNEARKRFHTQYNELKANSESLDEASDHLFKETMRTLDGSTELVKQRGLFRESTAAVEFRKLRNKYHDVLQETVPSPGLSAPDDEEKEQGSNLDSTKNT